MSGVRKPYSHALVFAWFKLKPLLHFISSILLIDEGCCSPDLDDVYSSLLVCCKWRSYSQFVFISTNKIACHDAHQLLLYTQLEHECTPLWLLDI